MSQGESCSDGRWDEVLADIESYRDDHWDEVLADIESLVEIASVEDLAAAADGAPYGPGPQEALDRALAIASRMGFDTHDCEGYIGYADLLAEPGSPRRQLGIIGHVDVVPAGPGWTYEPYGVTRREGYLVGRGVIDDKGPLMVALHALKYWKDRALKTGESLPYDVRVLFGVNEETNMKDVAYYREHHDDPDFLFTPDSQFPVGYGESGICSGMLRSAPIDAGHIVEMHGGQAVNAVPGSAWAVVRCEARPDAGPVASASGISVQPCNDGPSDEGRLWRIEAHGVSAHAMEPELGRNAIGMLVDFMLNAGIGTVEERCFMRLQKTLHDHVDGSGFGIEAYDEHFGALSAVGGITGLEDGRLYQSVDFRYPTTISASEIEKRMQGRAAKVGASFKMEHDKAPFLMDPESHAVRALLSAYSDVTGDKAEGLTSKGGTYARCFTRGVSFGVEKPWISDPAWVGGMHGPDEGVSEELLKQSFAIYALALGKLAKVKW